MKDVFISHVQEDSTAALAYADWLERAGFTVWYYERDSDPGPSYLLQTAKAIQQCKAVLLIISNDALSSHQITKEVVRAHESNKPFIPLLLGVSHEDFHRRQPEWQQAIGAAASIAISPEQTDDCIRKIIRGLSSLGVAANTKSTPKGDMAVSPGVQSSDGGQKPHIHWFVRPMDFGRHALVVGWRWFLFVAIGVAAMAMLWPYLVSLELRRAIEKATAGNVDSRVAGISELGGLWERAADTDLPLMVDTLSQLLRSDSEQLRNRAAKAIGDAYSDSTPPSRQAKLRRLLYGSNEGGYQVGAVVQLNWDLQKDPARFAQELAATREAIRKNWENLRRVHLRGASLIGADLYQSRMQDSYLEDADLRCADLWDADLTGAFVKGVKWRFANVKDLKPETLREDALAQGAVILNVDEWKATLRSPECKALVDGLFTGL